METIDGNSNAQYIHTIQWVDTSDGNWSNYNVQGVSTAAPHGEKVFCFPFSASHVIFKVPILHRFSFEPPPFPPPPHMPYL